MGFAGSNMSPKIDQKSIKNRFQVELALKCVPRRSQDVPRRPQDAPKTPQGSQDGPKMRPRRPQDAPRTPQDAPPGAENLELKSVFLADPLQTSILERLGLDFGRFWHRFWEVFWMVLKELKSHKILKKLGGFGINFEKCFGWF